MLAPEGVLRVVLESIARHVSSLSILREGAMKVLLFVQTGDGRPKCIGEHNERETQWGKRMRGTTRQVKLKLAADRWWLVECENAEAGRRMIAEDQRGVANTAFLGGGGILASGGRS